MDLSIIIISYNTKDITKKCLDTIQNSLKDALFSTEIMVIDNNSKDGSVEMLQDYKNAITNNKNTFTFIQSKENLGFGKANNVGAQKAKADILLFLNSDIEVLGDSVPQLYDYFISSNTYQFVGGKLFNKDMTPQPSVSYFFTPLVVFGSLFLKGDYWGLTRSSPNTEKKVDWISGACFMTDKKSYEKIHGFDEEIFMYMEEVDLFYRAFQKGMKVGYYPESTFIHLGSASSAKRTQPILQVYKGLLYFYRKHYSSTELIILKNMLKLKAGISLILGHVKQHIHPAKEKNYLLTTYEEAYRIAKNN